MGIWVFYLLALIPIAVGGFLWLTNRRVTWQEWLGGSAVCLITAGVFQWASIAGRTTDTETWSGWITHATHYPRWVEEYQQMHTREVSCGKDCTTTEVYFTTEYRTHQERWVAYTSIPDEHEISQSFFREIASNFGGKITTEQPHKSGFHSGDRNIYVSYRATEFIYPVTAKFRWTNKIKAAPTLFSFAAVPTNVAVYAYPENHDWLNSDRLMGDARSRISAVEFDRMNARLGARKRINVILIGFGNRTADIAEWQRAAWIGGKKNDLVLCYGGNPRWAKVFGWSDSEICKRNLESILLKHNGPSMLPEIEREIQKNYTIKDWGAFDYIKVEPPTWSYWVFALVLLTTQAGFYAWAHMNEFDEVGGI